MTKKIEGPLAVLYPPQDGDAGHALKFFHVIEVAEGMGYVMRVEVQHENGYTRLALFAGEKPQA